MLHFFSVQDLCDNLRVAERFTNNLRGIRDQTTEKINAFIRRRLDVETGLTEYLDSNPLAYGQAMEIYLRKKNISNFSIWHSCERLWDDTTVLNTDCYMLDEEQGKITLFGPMRPWRMSLKVTYDGGWGPTDADPEVMACPEGLAYYALQQAIFDGRRFLSADQGIATDDDKKTKVKIVSGLLAEVADAFRIYRRTLGG